VDRRKDGLRRLTATDGHGIQLQMASAGAIGTTGCWHDLLPERPHGRPATNQHQRHAALVASRPELIALIATI
jgi:hypothetical protein